MSNFAILPVKTCGRATTPDWRYGMTLTGQVLSCWDADGALRFQVDVPGIGSDVVRRIRSTASGRQGLQRPSIAWQVGAHLILTGGSNVVAIDLLAAARGDGDESIAWTASKRIQAATEARPQGGFPITAGNASTTAAARSLPSQPDRWTAVAASHAGVLVRSGETIACLDPTTGEVGWLRSGLQAEGMKLFADGHQAVGKSSQRTVQLRMQDGRLIERSTDDDEWIDFRNGLLTTRSRDDGRALIRVLDTESWRPVLTRSFDEGLIARVQGADRLIVAEQSDDTIRPTLVDLTTGGVTACEPIAYSGPLTQVSARADRNGLLVAFSQTTKTDLRAVGISPLESGPLLSGPLVCFSSEGAVVWRADIAGMEFLDRTPMASPLVVLGRRDHKRVNSSLQVTSQLLLLDGATGRSVHHEKEMREDTVGAFRLRYEAGPRPALHALFPRSETEVRVTTVALPPGPAFHAGVESPTRLSVDDLLGMGQELWRATSEAIRPKPSQPEEE